MYKRREMSANWSAYRINIISSSFYQPTNQMTNHSPWYNESIFSYPMTERLLDECLKWNWKGFSISSDECGSKISSIAWFWKFSLFWLKNTLSKWVFCKFSIFNTLLHTSGGLLRCIALHNRQNLTSASVGPATVLVLETISILFQIRKNLFWAEFSRLPFATIIFQKFSNGWDIENLKFLFLPHMHKNKRGNTKSAASFC